MLLSDLIEELVRLKNEHGDMPVACNGSFQQNNISWDIYEKNEEHLLGYL